MKIFVNRTIENNLLKSIIFQKQINIFSKSVDKIDFLLYNLSVVIFSPYEKERINMFKCKIADFIIEIDNKYEYSENACRDYLYAGAEKADLRIALSDEEIECEQIPEQNSSRPLMEFTGIYRKFHSFLLDNNACVMHCSLISLDGKGTAFLAPSGTGKTTHTAYWKSLYKEKLVVVNGDKPIIRIINGKIIAYGTPWSGKERWQTNTSAELYNLAFIKRSEKNFVEKISADEALPLLMQQLLVPTEKDKMLTFLDIVNHLLSKCNLYNIYCNMSEEAAKIACETLYS